MQDSNTALFKALLARQRHRRVRARRSCRSQYDPAPLINGEVDGFIAYLTNEAITVAGAGDEIDEPAFADNGLPFVAETFTVTDRAPSPNDREKLKAFLIAEIKGWTDAVNDPEARRARLAYEEYGARPRPRTSANSIEPAPSSRPRSSDRLPTRPRRTACSRSPTSCRQQTIERSPAPASTLEADELFDLSLLEEVYEENPDLVDVRGLTRHPIMTQ